MVRLSWNVTISKSVSITYVTCEGQSSLTLLACWDMRKSNFKSLNMLSRLRKKSKRFIYTINNTLVYQEENVQKEVTSESPDNPVLTHLESDLHEFKDCQVATDGNQGMLLRFSLFLEDSSFTKYLFCKYFT